MSQFKSIVRQAVIDCSRVYEEVFVNYDYLVCSTAFKLNPFYVIDAKEDNYKHLTGVSTEMSALQFYRKCIDGSLTENDFGFEKAGQSKNEVRNFVKLKISILPFIGSIFSPDTLVEENFTKGRITCSFATSTSKLTLGFSVGKAVRPKSLLKGSLINSDAGHLDLVLRRKTGTEFFDEMIVGTAESLAKYRERIASLIV